ncbi:MAG: T9SS type A sorting domain-containing protein [Fidelibacterota bacterium]|nr:MAG: T9SS type A sorting domain-containing protein [Candidatus Neomarinimicrobiota bacterium]
MKEINLRSSLVIIFLVCIGFFPLTGQVSLEYLGMAEKDITAMSVYGSIMAIGTHDKGVFYTDTSYPPDTNWTSLGLEDKNISAVYPHKSGPIGWGITAGVFPEDGDSVYVYCNHMGGEFFTNSAGISDSFGVGIYSLAGFPDPTICGEKYAATGGALFRQALGDTTWKRLLTSIYLEEWWIMAVGTKEHIGGLVLAGGSDGYTGGLLLKSLDFGDTWDQLYPPHLVMALDFGVVSTGTDVGYIFATDGAVISRSLDGGSTWEAVFTEEYLHTFESILYDSYTGYVFAAGSVGTLEAGHILYSQDLGDSWLEVPTDTLGKIVDLAYPGDGYLYFAAAGSGVFRFPLTTLAVPESSHTPAAFALRGPYPNPFNPVSTIQYDLPQATYVSLTIYNILGREVVRLVDDYMEPGYHYTQWNGRNQLGHSVPSGIYIARLVAPEYSNSTKMLLLK